ncbi:MAG TPA: T9SS type A sorting domain-containing protein, partial [Bacteroidia bacterium]|nr:T9SS type A sorting domain-containing protein [Bacteroidia bacterium]
GILQYNESGTSTKIQNIKQVISSGCTVQLTSGNMQAASLNYLVKDMIRVASGGVIDAGTKQIYSNTTGLYSGIKVDENGTIRTSNPEGFYNGAANATIKANGNFTFTLHTSSVVEYYGASNQIITGTGVGTAQTTDQQYGVLKINKPNSSAKINSSNIYVRNSVELDAGELNLNGYNLVLTSGSAQAILQQSGYIKSETSASATNSMVIWKNIESGEHSIPFGIAPDKMIPFKFSPISGMGNEISVSTRSCAKNNRPLPAGVTNINLNNSDISNDRVIDRWYHVNANGIKANITLSYLPNENSTISSVATKNFSAMVWKNSQWNLLGGSGIGSQTETGTVTIQNCMSWGPILMYANEKLEQADLLSFEARLNGKQVDLNWISIPNLVVQSFIVEKSIDGFNFEELTEVPALPPSSGPISYADVDASPVKGISYYRLRQNSSDGKMKYSNVVRIEYVTGTIKDLQLTSVSPNPFTSMFTINCEAPTDGILNIRIVSVNGQIALSKSYEVTEGKNSLAIKDIEHLVPGIYILSVTDGKTLKSYKLFKN